MNLKEFKKQLKQLEDKLLTDYGLTEEEIEVTYFDPTSFYEDYRAFSAEPIDNLEIIGSKIKFIYLS